MSTASSPVPHGQLAPPPLVPTISADERLLLCSLLETAQFGPAVKAIFDRQWYQSSEYQWILQESVHLKQGQIKQICEEHYAEFLSGIEHLLAVKLDLSELRSLAQSLNLSVQQSGRAVLASARQLNEQRRLRYQINSAKHVLQSCASLIALARKAKQQIYHSKYFSALKTLNQLQRILHVAATNFHQSNASIDSSSNPNGVMSNPVSPNGSISPVTSSSKAKQGAGAQAARFEFIQQLERQIPLLTGKIKESVRAEFTTWLNGISKRSHAIGELALAQLDEYLTASTKKASARRAASMDGRSRPSRRPGASPRAGGKKNGDGDSDEDEFLGSEEEDDSLVQVGAGAMHTSANLFDTIPINFTPIYQCLHIYEHLNLAEQFQNLYKEKRKAQLMEVVNSLATLTVASPRSTTASTPAAAGSSSSSDKNGVAAGGSAPQRDFIESYSSVFAGITGFFLIEDNILRSGNELISRAEIDTLYEKVQTSLIGYLELHFSACAAYSPAYLLQLKYLTVLFCKIMDENFLGHDSGLLRTFLEDQRTAFEEILLVRFRGEMRRIFSKERWEPLGIKNLDEYNLFVLGFGLQEESIAVDFPCTMPFSISVPLLCRILANFTEDYFQYARFLQDDAGSAGGGGGGGGGGQSAGGDGGFGRVSASWKGHVLRALDRALSEEVNPTFLAMLQVPNLPISQTVQFSINAQVLSELTCTFLERLVARQGMDESASASASSDLAHHLPTSVNPHSGASSPYSLTSRHLLLSTKLRCEDLIFELIAQKIDEFLDLHSGFQWTPDQVQAGPSDYILDLIAYLETTFHHFSFVPDAVNEAVHFTSCKHIADTYLDTLASTSNPHCKKFNLIAIANLNQDLHVVEAFAARCPIQNLVETFSEIRQLVDLLLSGDVDVLLEPSARAQRYPHLSSHKLIRILTKFTDISMFSMSTPAQFKKLKKKQCEAVVKALQKRVQ